MVITFNTKVMAINIEKKRKKNSTYIVFSNFKRTQYFLKRDQKGAYLGAKKGSKPDDFL